MYYRLIRHYINIAYIANLILAEIRGVRVFHIAEDTLDYTFGNIELATRNAWVYEEIVNVAYHLE